MEENKEKPLTREEKELKRLESHLQTITEIRELDSEEITGYFYRETTGVKPETLPQVEGVLTDDEVGRRFGPGRYKAIYRIYFEDGTYVSKQIRYRIAKEFAKLHLEYCRENGEQYFGNLETKGQNQDGLMSMLSGGKAQELIALAAGIKSLFSAPPPPPPQSMSDAVMVAMIQNMKPQQQPNAIEQMKSQLDLFSCFRDTMSPPAPALPPPVQTQEKEMSFLEKAIETGLQFLPDLLQKNNGDIAKAANAAKAESSKLRALLKIPSVHRPAYQALCRQYGQNSADQWAIGLGLDPSKLRGEVVAKSNNKNEVVFG